MARRRLSGLIERLLYRVYERRLLRRVRQWPMPAHLALILDGNRRHARELGLSDPRGIYDLGASKLDAVLDWCAELGIATITLWVLSTDNLKRAPEWVSGIVAAIETKIGALARDPQIHRRRVRIRAVGRPDLLRAVRAFQRRKRRYGR